MGSTPISRIARWTWLLVAVAAIYAGTTVYQRWHGNRAAEQAVVQHEADADRKVVNQLGGGEMKILVFYADPPVLHAGAKGRLCYGVASAKSVRIEPTVDDVWPALSRCVDVKPAAPATTYTLTATDSRGKVDTRTVQVSVR